MPKTTFKIIRLQSLLLVMSVDYSPICLQYCDNHIEIAYHFHFAITTIWKTKMIALPYALLVSLQGLVIFLLFELPVVGPP